VPAASTNRASPHLSTEIPVVNGAHIRRGPDVVLVVETAIAIGVLAGVALIWRTRRFFGSLFAACRAFEQLAYAVMGTILTGLCVWAGFWLMAVLTASVAYVAGAALIGNFVDVQPATDRKVAWAVMAGLIAFAASVVEAAFAPR